MVEFIRLIIENFLSYESVDLPLEGKDIVLIVGRNGSGKSALFEAINWCLFNKLARSVSPDEVIHHSASSCKVQVWLRIDGVNWTITRSRKRKESSKLEILREGKVVAFPLTQAAQDFIENQLLLCSFDVFTSSVMLNQALYNRFSLASDKDKKQMLEEILGFDWFDELLQFTRDQLRLRQGRTERYEEKEKSSNSQMVNFQSLVKKLQEQGAVNLEEMVKEAKVKKEMIDVVKSGIDKTEAERLVKVKAVDSVRGKMNDLKWKVDLGDKQMRDIEREVKSLQESLENIPDVCDKCGSPLKGETLSTYVRSLRDGVQAKESALKALREEQERLKMELEEVSLMLNGATGEVEQLDRSLNLLRQEYEQWVREYDVLQKRIAECRNDISVEMVRAEIEKLEKIISHYKERKKVSEKIEKYYEFWEKGFGQEGVKNFLLGEVLKFIEEECNKFLYVLGDGKIKVKLSPISELKSGDKRFRFSFSAFNFDGATSYQGLSEGEKKRVDLSIILAIQMLLRSCGRRKFSFVFFDEIFETVDSEGINKIYSLLKSLTISPIFVISHREDLIPYFNSIWKVGKKDGVSFIEEVER